MSTPRVEKKKKHKLSRLKKYVVYVAFAFLIIMIVVGIIVITLDVARINTEFKISKVYDRLHYYYLSVTDEYEQDNYRVLDGYIVIYRARETSFSVAIYMNISKEFNNITFSLIKERIESLVSYGKITVKIQFVRSIVDKTIDYGTREYVLLEISDGRLMSYNNELFLNLTALNMTRLYGIFIWGSFTGKFLLYGEGFLGLTVKIS